LLGRGSSPTSPPSERHEEATIPSSIEPWLADDDLSRQRRKREARLLDGAVADFPDLTVADVVADVLAASNEGHSALDVPSYLVARGHTSATIKTVVDYLQRQRPPLRVVGPPGPPTCRD
jgi:hypothetical protein